MGVKSKNPKKKWVEGKDMPFFSGKTWAELEDIWPRNKRIDSNVWRMMGLIAPAWVITQEYCAGLVGEKIFLQDLNLLCFMQRVEEARDNVAFDSYHILKGMNFGASLYTTRKAKLHKLGLVEKMPLKRLRIYRITGLGKMLIHEFVSNLQKANDNLLGWIESQPKEHQVKISQSLSLYCRDLFPPLPTDGEVGEGVDPD